MQIKDKLFINKYMIYVITTFLYLFSFQVHYIPVNSINKVTIIQNNYNGFTEYKYDITDTLITIDSIVIDSRVQIRIFEQKIYNDEFLTISSLFPEILNLDSVYSIPTIGGIDNTIILSNNDVILKTIIINNFQLEIKDSLYAKINLLLKSDDRKLLLM